ncbi:MAG: phosphatase PAP2 family protein, partial [Candidatus Shapirobacteria bacterium]|nr:phosphatase PAP2 family protein [Candidatus Shapirobacteria bacterium]
MWLKKIWLNKIWLTLAIIFLLAVVLFGKVLNGYLDKDGLMMLDRPINQMVLQLRRPFLDKLMLLVTLTGNWQMITWGSLLGAVLLIIAQKRRYLMAMILSNVSAMFLVTLVKTIIGRARPPVENALILEHGFAFPSGHSYFAVAFYGLLTYFWVRHFYQKWARIGVFILGSVYILLLGLSRIYLGVHWTTDVLGALSLGAAVLAVIVAYIEYQRKFFKEEYGEVNRKLLWRNFAIFAGLWLLGLFWLYQNRVKSLGTKISSPTRA